MTEKRFDIDDSDIVVDDLHTGKSYIFDDYVSCETCCELLNELYEKDKDGEECYKKLLEKYDKLKEDYEYLKSENNMLKITIGRNESYINRLTHKGEWK